MQTQTRDKHAEDVSCINKVILSRKKGFKVSAADQSRSSLPVLMWD